MVGLFGCGSEEPTNVIAPAITENGQANPNPNQSSSDTTQPQPDLPIVAQVNGEKILLSEFEKRVQQFQAADLARQSNYTQVQKEARLAQIEEQVLNGLIDQIVIAQAAQKQGIVITDEVLNSKIAEMKQNQTEAQFNEWLALNNYTFEDFKNTLRAQLIAAEMFAFISSYTPTSAEQVHARHILVQDLALAQSILARLQAGENFVSLAQQYSEDASTRPNGGDLGWFPMDIQLVPPQVESVAFSIQPGQISPIIESVLGYHIVKVEIKEADRPLTPQHRQILQINGFNQWLAQQRVSAQIERYIN